MSCVRPTENPSPADGHTGGCGRTRSRQATGRPVTGDRRNVRQMSPTGQKYAGRPFFPHVCEMLKNGLFSYETNR